MADRTVSTQVVIAGGGPAGMVLGLLLARAGIRTVVLEKHADFLRDFRGDTVHPSTLDLIDQLGIRDRFEAIEHTVLTRLDGVVNGVRVRAMDLSGLPGPNREIALMPQWDLLDLLAREAARSDTFELVMQAEADEVLRDADGRVTGVVAATPAGRLTVTADLTVAADGRGSRIRDALGLTPVETGVPVDVLWIRVPLPAVAPPPTLAYVSATGMVVTIPRPDAVQLGILIPKDGLDGIRAAGLAALRDMIAATAPPMREPVASIASWEQVKLLRVQISHLPTWSTPGAVCIGDAAHAMSPAFGVGINYAIQDAVALANALVPALRAGRRGAALDRVPVALQRRRLPPTRRIQRLQRAAHRVIATGRGATLLHDPPTRTERAFLRLVLPLVRPLAARVLTRGSRPERIDVALLADRSR